MSSQFGSAAVDIVDLLDKVFHWAGERLGMGASSEYSSGVQSEDLAALVNQSAARLGWVPSTASHRLEISLIDGSASTVAKGDRLYDATYRLQVVFGFADARELGNDELMAGYSQLLKGRVFAATCIASDDGGALALALITTSMQSEGHGDAWWEFVDALITFGSFKLSLLSRHARRASEALGRAAVLSDDMLSEISAHNSARFRERHSLKEISKNLKHELLHHRIKGGARNAVATKESYFRAASGKLLKEAGALTPRHHFDGSILRMLAENAVRSHCALYISEDHTFGGLEQWVCDFARYLRKRNYVPYLIVKGFPALNSRIASEFPGEVLYLQGDDSALAEVIKRCRIESIVVNHVYGGLDNVPETCKVIEVLHNIYFWQVGEDAVAKLRQRVDCFVAVSSEVASYAKIYLSLSVERLVIVPHGINIEGLYRPPVQYLEKVRRRTDAFDILFVGNLYPQKNVICLVEAFAKLRSHASHARLRLAGALSEAEYSAHIKATVERLGLGESVVFLGSLNRAALSREYTHAHMFVFPSLYEGYGLVNLEAAYFGLPMVLSNTGCAETIAQATNACRIARIAAPHDELQRNEIVLKSKRPSQDDVHELYTQIVKIHDDYENYLADGLGMIAKPPFGMADDAGSAVCKLLKSA